MQQRIRCRTIDCEINHSVIRSFECEVLLTLETVFAEVEHFASEHVLELFLQWSDNDSTGHLWLSLLLY
jgi:hypothetical protein